jgi:prevent-host-death family protein
MKISVYNAKTQLSRLLDRAAEGEEIVITRHGRPIAKLVAAEPAGPPRTLGRMRGSVRMADDFDAPLPDEVLDAFEGR